VASALERRMSEARDHLSALQSKLALTGDVEVVPGPAAEALLRFIEARSPDLVVVGTHGRTGLRRLVLGSVAEKVVRASPSSVLVTRLRPAPA